MRKHTIITFMALAGLLFIIGSQSVNSQTLVPKKPLLELFTSSSCPPCAGFNPVLGGLLEDYPGQYTLIKYQMYWPGDGDPYYFVESKKRRDYYTITGVPGLTYNGTKQVPYAQNFTKARLDSLLALLTSMNLGVVGSITGANLVSGHLTITPLINYAAGLVAHIVVMEGITTENATSNGERAFENVTMGFMPNANGTVLGALTAGQPFDLEYTLDMTGTNMETGNDLFIAAFIQDNTTKEVLQSEIAPVTHPFTDFSASFLVYDDDFNLVPGGNLFMKKMGFAPIGADGRCTVSGILPGTYPWDVAAPGYEGAYGSVTITDANYSGEIQVVKPDELFYEDFDNNVIPGGWDYTSSPGVTISATSGGTVLFYKPGEGGNDNYLMLPPTNITQDGAFMLRAGQDLFGPTFKLGTVTTEPVPGTDGINGVVVTGFTELGSAVVHNALGFSTVSFRLPASVGTQRLALKFECNPGDYVYLDMVVIHENMPGVKVAFLVIDQDDQPLPETVVTFNGNALVSNTFGYSTFRDTDPGTYSYEVTYKDEVVASGNVEVEDVNLLKTIQWNTSGVHTELASLPVNIYPNPAKTQFVVEGIEQGTLVICDLAGREIQMVTLLGDTTVKIPKALHGIYLLKIESMGKTVMQKIVIE